MAVNPTAPVPQDGPARTATAEPFVLPPIATTDTTQALVPAQQTPQHGQRLASTPVNNKSDIAYTGDVMFATGVVTTVAAAAAAAPLSLKQRAAQNAPAPAKQQPQPAVTATALTPQGDAPFADRPAPTDNRIAPTVNYSAQPNLYGPTQLNALQQAQLAQLTTLVKPQDPLAFQQKMAAVYQQHPQVGTNLLVNMQNQFHAAPANQPINALQKNMYVNNAMQLTLNSSNLTPEQRQSVRTTFSDAMKPGHKPDLGVGGAQIAATAGVSAANAARQKMDHDNGVGGPGGNKPTASNGPEKPKPGADKKAQSKPGGPNNLEDTVTTTRGVHNGRTGTVVEQVRYDSRTGQSTKSSFMAFDQLPQEKVNQHSNGLKTNPGDHMASNQSPLTAKGANRPNYGVLTAAGFGSPAPAAAAPSQAASNTFQHTGTRGNLASASYGATMRLG